MNEIQTRFTEKQFLRRLETLCKPKTCFDKGYNAKDIFVVKRNKHKFWLGKHYALIGRTDGYAIDTLFCRYFVNKNGFVVIQYRFAKRLTYKIPFLLVCMIGFPLWIYTIYNAILSGEWFSTEMIVTALLWLLGVSGLLLNSKKEKASLIEHLLKICKSTTSDIYKSKKRLSHL